LQSKTISPACLSRSVRGEYGRRYQLVAVYHPISADSTIHNSIYAVCSEFVVQDDNEWNYVVSNGNYVTDVVNDFGFALRFAQRCGADEILAFRL
jgi:hypothetical protein